MSNKNPCMDCQHKGCGNHANCDKYMEFFNELQRQGERRRQETEARRYTIEEIMKVKHNRSGISFRKYRPKGGG